MKHKWFKPRVDLRGRLEAYTGINFIPGSDDIYYLSRLRLNAAIEARSWLRFFLEGQDSRVPGYGRSPVPGSVEDPFDFRQGYFELGSTENGSWGFRVGRQELLFGNGRLIGNSNWGNVARTFDAACFTYKKNGIHLDAFTSSVVVPTNGGFDRPHFNNKFHGFYSSFSKLPAWSTANNVDTFFLVKTNSLARSKLGAVGNLCICTLGTRVIGKLPRDFDYRVEMAYQTGHVSRDPVRAWAGHWQLGYRPPFSHKSVRLAAEFNGASGDSNPHDGWHNTFDQLYPTSHDKLGTLDRIGWRNIRDLSAKMEWKPVEKWTLNVEYHDFWLATRQDYLYAKDGTTVLRNPNATSSRIGDEVDFYVAGWNDAESPRPNPQHH